jgi:hypothetical protein
MPDLNWIAPTIAATSALVVSVVGAMKSWGNGRKVEVVATKVETVLEKATEIHTATNGTLHQATEATNAANALKEVMEERVKGLEKQLAAALKSGDLAATAASQAADDVRAAQAVTPPETHEAG